MEKLYQILKDNGMTAVLQNMLDANVMPVMIAVFGFFLILSIAVIYKPKDKLLETYQKLNNSIIERKKIGLFDYDSIKAANAKNGLAYYHPVLADPVIYTGVSICLGAVLCIPAIKIHIIMSIAAFAAGYKLFDVLYFFKNKKDNEKMVGDIQFLYNTLSIQIKGGVYIMDALCESYRQINNSRLKTALMELSGEILLKADSKEAITHFQNKFNNQYIDSLCIAISQSLNSGKAVDLLADISEQIKTFQESLFRKKKANMDTAMSIATIILFADAMIFVLYVMVKGLIKEAAFF